MCGKEPLSNYYYYYWWIIIVITLKLFQQPKLYKIIIYKIYHDVTIFWQPIVYSYRSLYGVNVIIFDQYIHCTSFDSNKDPFIKKSPLNIYWNSIQAGLAFMCIIKTQMSYTVYWQVAFCKLHRHIKSTLASICQHCNNKRVQTCHIYSTWFSQ